MSKFIKTIIFKLEIKMNINEIKRNKMLIPINGLQFSIVLINVLFLKKYFRNIFIFISFNITFFNTNQSSQLFTFTFTIIDIP